MQNKATETIATAFFNTIRHKNETVSGINADVFFYNENYTALSNYQFNNGNFIPYSGKVQNKRMDGESQAENSSLIETELCQVWNVYLNTYDEWGVLISQVFLFSYEVGNCGGDPNEDQVPEGEGGAGEDEEYDLEAEGILMSQVLSTMSSPQEKNINYYNETLATVPFQWTVVENALSLWKVLASGNAEDYNSANTGAIIYRITHQGSGISGQTTWNRVRRDGSPGIPFISLAWSENSNSTSIASDYKSGTVSVSGTISNLGFPLFTRSQTCTIRVN